MYLTIQEFIDRVGLEFTISLISQRLGSKVDVKDHQAQVLLNNTIKYASDTIDNYLTKVYVLPLSETEELKYSCEIISLQMLFIHPDEENTKKHEEILAYLRGLSSKKIELKGATKKRIKNYK